MAADGIPLMGDNYIGDDVKGRDVHGRRMEFEKGPARQWE